MKAATLRTSIAAIGKDFGNRCIRLLYIIRSYRSGLRFALNGIHDGGRRPRVPQSCESRGELGDVGRCADETRLNRSFESNVVDRRGSGTVYQTQNGNCYYLPVSRPGGVFTVADGPAEGTKCRRPLNSGNFKQNVGVKFYELVLPSKCQSAGQIQARPAREAPVKRAT